MRWNIQNYYGKASYKQDMQLYEKLKFQTKIVKISKYVYIIVYNIEETRIK